MSVRVTKKGENISIKSSSKKTSKILVKKP
jgi:hypothetical protein